MADEFPHITFKLRIKRNKYPETSQKELLFEDERHREVFDVLLNHHIYEELKSNFYGVTDRHDYGNHFKDDRSKVRYRVLCTKEYEERQRK